MKCTIEYDKDFEELAEKAERMWGIKSQIDMMIEESLELALVLTKRFREVNGSSLQEVIDEFVDVEIMLGQMKNLYGLNQDMWKKTKKYKLDRLIARTANNGENEK
jgi:hypothetical protein